eukprot:SM000241S08512  [mRNA]  locus=s241:180993:181911:+ [translate_table: standard]
MAAQGPFEAVPPVNAAAPPAVDPAGGTGSAKLGFTEASPSTVAAFPRRQPRVAPLRMTTEDTAEEPPARNMWQVYVIAAYLVGRWAWGQIQQRRARRRFVRGGGGGGEDDEQG